MTRKQFFSLVELMIVIAIIGILPAIAIANYRTCVVKGNVATGIGLLTNAIDIAVKGYEKDGTWPNPITVYVNSMAVGSIASISIPPAEAFLYNSIQASIGGIPTILFHYRKIQL